MTPGINSALNREKIKALKHHETVEQQKSQNKMLQPFQVTALVSEPLRIEKEKPLSQPRSAVKPNGSVVSQKMVAYKGEIHQHRDTG